MDNVLDCVLLHVMICAPNHAHLHVSVDVEMDVLLLVVMHVLVVLLYAIHLVKPNAKIQPDILV